MKTEKPKNKKPLIYYYFVMLIALMAFNLFVTPMIQNQRIKEVGYSDLLAALDEKQVDEVEVDNQTGKIAYTIKDNKKNVFVTGIMPNDTALTDRLEQSGAQYTAVIPQQNSFLMDMLMWLVPIIIILGVGQLFSKQLAKKMGANTMTFGKSNAKIYVSAETGKTFKDVAGQDTDRSGQSASKTITCLPPAPSKPRVSAGDEGVAVSWTTRADVDGYQVFRSTAKNGTFDLIATVTDPAQNTYVDDEIQVNTTYYYKVRRYVYTEDGNAAYSNRSTVTDGAGLHLGVPGHITTTRTGTTAIRMNWKPTEHAVRYTVAYRLKGGRKWTYFSTTACNYTFKNLKVKSTYQFRVQAVSPFGAGAYSATESKQALPPTPGSVKVQRIRAKSAKVSWSKSQGFTGYYILRSTDKKFKKNVKKITVKSNKALSYTDKSVKKGTRYYYKVCRYTGKTSGSYSKTVSVKI